MKTPSFTRLSLSTVAIALTLALSGCHSDDLNSDGLTSELIPAIPLEPSIPMPPEVVEIQYEKIIDKWTYPMVLTAEEREKEIYKEVLASRFDAGRRAQESMVRDQADHLWATHVLVSNDTGVVHNKNMIASFNYIKTMALAYNSFDELATDIMRDDILYGLDFMLKDYYAIGKASTGNWYEWEIAVPKSLYDTLSLMEDHITERQQAQFDTIVKMANDATRWFVPDPNWQHYGEGATREPMAAEGANKVDLSLVVLMRGAFEQNDADIKMAIDALPTVLAPVTTANGFYDDGSFIQHANIPYIGTYGVTLLSGIGKVMNAITDTGIDLSDARYQTINEYLFSAVEPFMYEGKMMDAVSGRAIARGWVQNHAEGRSALNALLSFYDSRDAETQARLGALIKSHLALDPDTYFATTGDLNLLSVADRIMTDADLKPQAAAPGNFMFYNQDRVVHRGNNYALSLSLHSDRIGNYECLTTTDENLKGWYTGDGMTYLYDADRHQYTDWYALVDKRYLPGTTTDGATLPDCGGRRQYDNTKKDMTWVGGASNGDIGLYGANFYNHNNSLRVKKSYFMFDDEIVALGTDFSAKGNKGYTVIDNRKLNENGTNALTVDGAQWTPENNQIAKPVNSFHVAGNVDGSALGVYLPTAQSVTMKYHSRNGDWKVLYPENLNKMDDTRVSGWALQTQIEHNNDSKTAYSYVLLPTYNAEQTADYGGNPDVNIVAQTADFHVVEEKTLKVVAANAFSETAQISTQVKTVGELSVLMVRDGDLAKVWVSQPTRTDKAVQVAFPQSIGDTLVSDEDDRVTLVDGFWEVDTIGLDGEAYFFSYRVN